MAQAEKAKTSKETTQTDMWSPPPGYTSQSTLDFVGWFKPVKGLIMEGLLMERHPRFEGAGHFYQVKLTKPCTVVTKDAEIEAKIGDIINVDERKAVETLRDLTGEKNSVIIQVIDKKTLKGGNSFWDMAVFAKPVNGSK